MLNFSTCKIYTFAIVVIALLYFEFLFEIVLYFDGGNFLGQQFIRFGITRQKKRNETNKTNEGIPNDSLT